MATDLRNVELPCSMEDRCNGGDEAALQQQAARPNTSANTRYEIRPECMIGSSSGGRKVRLLLVIIANHFTHHFTNCDV